jgi:ankyrin repeat protein
LHWAILGNHPTVIHLMHQAYKHKGDTRNFMQLVNHNLKPKKDRVAERPLLLYALFKESLASFEQLLEVGADPHVRDKDGKNALFYATLYLSDKEFDAFCDRHVHLYKHTLSEMEYENKNTLLTCAISENQLHKFSRILGMTGVDVFQRDGKHNLPVHRVVMNAYEEMVRLLVPHGGLTMENGIGMTPVELARAVWLVEFNNSDYSAKELVVDGEESEEEESDDSEEEEDEEKNKADTVNRLAVLRQFPPVSQARLLTPSNKLYWIAKSTATLLSRTTRATPKPTYANFSTNAIHPK